MKRKLNSERMLEEKKIIDTEQYRVWDTNCVNAVVRVLFAGGVSELERYVLVKIIPHPRKAYFKPPRF